MEKRDGWVEGRGQTGGTEGQEEDKGSAEAAGAAGSTTITITTSTAVAMRLHGHQQPPTATTFPWSPTRDTCPCPHPVPPGRGGHHHGATTTGATVTGATPTSATTIGPGTAVQTPQTMDSGHRGWPWWPREVTTARPPQSPPTRLPREVAAVTSPGGCVPCWAVRCPRGWPVTLQPCPSTHTCPLGTFWAERFPPEQPWIFLCPPRRAWWHRGDTGPP